jgi:hypothetical protein
MVQPVDMACFSARFLALLRRFPNQLQENSCVIMPAPGSEGALVFSSSHNHHYLLFHDPTGFSNGVYEFGLPEEFFSAIGPRHVGVSSPGVDANLKLALSNGEYRLYENTENSDLFESAADSRVVFTWSGSIGRARQQLREAMDAILYLHQEGKGVEVTQTLNTNYLAEVDFIRRQLAGEQPINFSHRWIRLPDDSLRCLTHFVSASGARSRVQALICVNADMVLG